MSASASSPGNAPILVVNSGSSSLKFGLFVERDGEERAIVKGSAEDIGSPVGMLSIVGANGAELLHSECAHRTQDEALSDIVARLSALDVDAPAAVAHRMVHGGPHLTAHCRITPEIERLLAEAVHFAPLHIPAALAIIRHTEKLYPQVPQFACFDTSFHRTMPEEAYRYALPAEYLVRGVRRYGFHGLSCASIVGSFGETMPKRAVIAHLGSGASLTAVRDGQSIDTSMGMTPTGGIPMGSRTGDLDPGVMLFLMRDAGLGVDKLEHLLNYESGMIALDGVNDMRLLERRAAEGSHQAAMAIEIFCRAIAKTVASYAAVLGKIDALIFAGGIGEHSASTRTNVCQRLEFLGLVLDEVKNAAGTHSIAAANSKVAIYIVKSLEEVQIAREVRQLL